MAFDQQQIKAVEKIRRLSYKDFDNIELSSEAMQLVANLFLNPDCMTDINLESFVADKKVKLSDFAKHIITAAPSTLAKYATEHNKLFLKRDDIIECFTIDHLQALADNKMDKIKNPSYALAHVMSLATVKNIRKHKGYILVDLKQNRIIYKNILVPTNVRIKLNDLVWHHFGVVIDKATTKDYQIFYDQQQQNYFWYLYNNVKKNLINFADIGRFKKDVIGGVIREDKRRKNIDYHPSVDIKTNAAVVNNSKINKIIFTN